MSMTGLETMQQDFVDAFESIMPVCTREGIYLHPGPKALEFAEEHGEDARGCHNTDAHLRSALVGRSETIGGSAWCYGVFAKRRRSAAGIPRW